MLHQSCDAARTGLDIANYHSTVFPAFTSFSLLKDSGSTHPSNDEFLNHSGRNQPSNRQSLKATLSKTTSSPTAVKSITPDVGGSRRLIRTLCSKTVK